MPVHFKTLILLFCFLPLTAQVQEEIQAPPHIKSIVFKGPTDDQFPIAQLGETISLEFDDINANEDNYYYRIVHCDYDWTPSDLLKSQYLNGIDNQRIIDYENSYSTLQAYSNYKISFPNQDTSFKVTGNYVLEIYNNNNDIVFSRRFIIYQDGANVGATIKRSRDFTYLNEKQVVHLNISPIGTQWVNPKNTIKIAILQNYQWPTALYNIQPQYTIGNQLVYKYDKETSFFGGNEFLNFDTSDVRAPSAAISRIEIQDLYHQYLFSDTFRADREYTYFPDINGDFVIRTLQGDDSSRESEYSVVHFSLPYTTDIGLNEVYIYGKFNNYALTEENKMIYNDQTGYMEAAMELKQGFYNYKYVIKTDKGEVLYNKVGGNFHFTENNYTILVYYRNFGDLYDSVIGVGAANSRDISN